MNLPSTFPPPAQAPHVKVCGLTRATDALLALELGAAFLGLIFADESPRRIPMTTAVKMLAEVREKASVPVRPVGVFVDEPIGLIEESVERLGLVAVQLHGAHDENTLAARLTIPVVRAVRVRGPQSREAIICAQKLGPVLLDAFAEGRHGGTGKTFDHALAVEPIGRGPVFIAGGLNPGNIGEIAARLGEAGSQPYAWDVSSGLEERPGVKSADRMRAFFDALKAPLADA